MLLLAFSLFTPSLDAGYLLEFPLNLPGVYFDDYFHLSPEVSPPY
jgi:hypothetical protein